VLPRRTFASGVAWILIGRGRRRGASGEQGEHQVNTRTIALVALIIAVVVLLLLLL